MTLTSNRLVLFKVIAINLLFTLSAHSASNCSLETCPVTQKTFDTTINRLKNIYPTIRFQSRWSDNSIQASARFRQIFLSGGFARKEGINLGGFITVACHEVGHALLSLSEGEADYFASSDCMKKFFNLNLEPDLINSYLDSNFEMASLCNEVFTTNKDIAQCIRIAISSKNAANLGRKRCITRMDQLQENTLRSSRSTISISNFYMRCLRTDPNVSNVRFPRNELLNILLDVSLDLKEELDFFSSDSRIVTRTYRSHNSPACRMQTLRHGNLFKEKPSCWFK